MMDDLEDMLEARWLGEGVVLLLVRGMSRASKAGRGVVSSACVEGEALLLKDRERRCEESNTMLNVFVCDARDKPLKKDALYKKCCTRDARAAASRHAAPKRAAKHVNADE